MFAPARNHGLVVLVAAAMLIAGETARADPVTIAALGDSLVQGYGLPPEQGFVPQMQAWLNANAAEVEVDLLNAGVSGDTTAGGLRRVDWTLTPEVDALIVSLGGNDVLRGLDPASVRANLDGILQIAKAQDVPVLLIGIGAPGNYGPDYREAFEAIYPSLSNEYSTLLYRNFLSAPLLLPDRDDAMARYFQSDRLHPNAEGVRLIVESIGPSIAELAKRAQP